MALVNQYSGGRNGNPNFHLYPLAAQFPSAFHDVATGTNAVPCTPGSPSCEIVQSGDMEGHTQGYDAGRGYDLATGLGSIDAYNLVTSWSRVVMPPAIVSVSPNPLTGSNSRQMVTVSGTGFRPDSGIAVLVDGAKDPNTQVVPISDTEIRLSTIAGVAARALSLQIVNSVGLASNTFVVRINAPAPAPQISSISPSPLAALGENQTVSIIGSGFQGGLKLQANASGSAANTLDPGHVSVIDSAHLLAVVNLGSTAQSWTFQITNPDGQASNAINIPITAPPHIVSISPNPISGSDSDQVLTIDGSGFQPGLTVFATPSPGVATGQGAQILSFSDSEIDVAMDVGSTARTLVVQVSNTSGQLSNAVQVPVNATAVTPMPPPAIFTIDPNPVPGSNFFEMVRITGAGFQAGALVELSYPGFSSTVTGGQVDVVSGSQILALLSLGSITRTWNLRVMNPDGQSSGSVSINVK
jgi:hypothetical protein